jgi:dolichyl-diphosphooligosaccharide--protein glycosyltransferase
MTEGPRVGEVLAERPEFESALADIAAVDDERETWTFDDVPVDSGTFGHLVSEGVVEKVDGEYRLANPEAVERALDGEETTGTVAEDGTPGVGTGFSLPSVGVDRTEAALLAGVLSVLVALRSLSVTAVFRGERIFLSGNDPYFYRHWVDRTLEAGTVGLVPFGEVPGSIENAEPFLVASLTWLSNLFGGSGLALALYPIVAAVLVGIAVYALTLRVTEDRRVGLAAVVMLATVPGHAFRTSLGYADHHAFDYVWLALTALALVSIRLSDDDWRAPGRWVAAAGLGVGVAGQLLAWNNGALLVVPVGVVVAAGVLFDVRSGRSPLLSGGPVLAGLGVAAASTFGAHTAFGWQSTVVTAVSALLLVGAGVVVAVGVAMARAGFGARAVAAVDAVLAAGGVAGLATLFPDLWRELQGGVARITAQRNIAEVQSLFSFSNLFSVLILGLLLVFAVPVLSWATVRLLRADDEWLVPVAYGWYLLLLASFQIRFVGELSMFVALFAGVAFVELASLVDLTGGTPLEGVTQPEWAPGYPEASTVIGILTLFAFVAGVGVVQSAVKIEQVSTPQEGAETAGWLADYADEQGLETRSEAYVFSDWPSNRMYNYFVNGESDSYGYAQSNYRRFIAQANPQTAESVLGARPRFVVTKPISLGGQAVGTRLHTHMGSRHGDTDGLSRYRAVYASDGGERKAFVVVPGARLNGTGPAEATLTLETDVDVPHASFTYERRVRTDGSGRFTLDVAYPGTYRLSADGRTWRVEVPERAVTDGTEVDASPS